MANEVPASNIGAWQTTAAPGGVVRGPPRRPARVGWPVFAVMLAVVAGAALSVQSFVNGRLAIDVGSSQLAACANNTVGLIGFLLLGVMTGAFHRARRQLRSGFQARSLWYLLPSMSGALYAAVAAAAAPKLGVALLTVATVCGQTAGGLVVDRAGISTAGHKRLSAWRICGAGVAVVAILVGLVGEAADPKIGLILMAVVVGALFSLQQATMSHIRRVVGEPIAAGAASMVISSLAAVVLLLATTGGSTPDDWSASPAHWLVGGILAVGIATVVIVTVPTLGVLRLGLALIAGQSVGALALDLLSPVDGKGVTPTTVLSILLMLVAVAISGRQSRSRTRRALVRGAG